MTPEGEERPIRVLFVSYTSESTGPTNSLQLLLEHLPSSVIPEVVLPGDGPLVADLGRRGIRVHRLDDLRRRQSWKLARIVRAGRFDLIYANTADGSARTALIAGKLSRTPVMCHLRGTGQPRDPRKLKYLRHVEAAIAVSGATAEAHRRFLVDRPCWVVHNGIPLAGQRSDGAAAHARLRELAGCADDVSIVVAVGNLSRRKNQIEIVQTMLALPEHHFHAVVFGRADREPSYTEALQQAIADAGLGSRFTLAGFTSDLPSLLPGASAFLHTASADPHPRAVLEAMLAGLPVVAYEVGGVGETVVDGVTGALASAGDTDGLARRLGLILDDPRSARRLGEAGRERVLREFSASSTAQQVASRIREVVRRVNGGS